MWAASNYPQIILHFRKRSIDGYSLEYQLWNISSFLFYSTYTIAGYFQQHSRPHLKNSIKVNDIAFACHNLMTNIILSTQCLYWLKTHTKGINKYHIVAVGALWLLVIYNVFLSIGGFIPWFSDSTSAYAFSTIQFLGFAKSFISFVKYVPQVYLNYSLKSTAGWSIPNTIMDFGGGALSFAQMIVIAYDNADAAGNPDWSQVTSNLPKLILAIESMMFDVILMVQHFVLYGPVPPRVQPGAGSGGLLDTGDFSAALVLSDDIGYDYSSGSGSNSSDLDRRRAAGAGGGNGSKNLGSTMSGHSIQRNNYVRFDN